MVSAETGAIVEVWECRAKAPVSAIFEVTQFLCCREASA